MKETAQQQLQAIAQSTRKTLEKGLESAGYAAKLKAGTLTVEDISTIADATGKMLSYSLRQGITGLTADDLPLGADFFDDIIPPMVSADYDLLNAVSAQIQEAVDNSQGIKIAAQTVDYPAERVTTISKAAGTAETPEKLQRLVTSPIENVSRSYADDYVKKNAEYRSNAGLECKIVRQTDGKCCEWCSKLAGIYDYGDEPSDVYRRHDNCGCVVTYINGKTAQNVWTKTEQTYDGELLEQDGSGELHVLEGNSQSFRELGKGRVGEKRLERQKSQQSRKSQVKGTTITHADGKTTTVTNLSQNAHKQIREGKITIDDISETIKSPTKVSEITTDKQGRKSFKVYGEKSTVYVNADSGIITAAYSNGKNTTKAAKKTTEKAKYAAENKTYPTIRVSTKEYAHVMSEIATNLTEEERNSPMFYKAIGNHRFLIKNNGFGDYEILERKKLK